MSLSIVIDSDCEESLGSECVPSGKSTPLMARSNSDSEESLEVRTPADEQPGKLKRTKVRSERMLRAERMSC